MKLYWAPAPTRLLPVYLLRIAWRKYDGTCVLTGDNCRSLPPIAISRLIIKWNEARPPSLALTHTSVGFLQSTAYYRCSFDTFLPSLPLSFAPSDCPHRYCRVSGLFPAVRAAPHPSLPHVTRSSKRARPLASPLLYRSLTRSHIRSSVRYVNWHLG